MGGSDGLRRAAALLEARQLAGELWPWLFLFLFLAWAILGFVQQ